MTQSTMRIHLRPPRLRSRRPKQSQAAKQKPKTTNAYASSNQKHDEQKAPQRTADTPSDVLANAAAETKRDKGVYASMKRAYVTPLPTVVNSPPANGSTMRHVAAMGNSTRNTLMSSTWMVRRSMPRKTRPPQPAARTSRRC